VDKFLFNPTQHFFLFDNLDKETKSSLPSVAKAPKQQYHATLMLALTAQSTDSSNRRIQLENVRLLDPSEYGEPTREHALISTEDFSFVETRLVRSLEQVLKTYYPSMISLPYFSFSFLLFRTISQRNYISSQCLQASLPV
jgi:hypothetical protein